MGTSEETAFWLVTGLPRVLAQRLLELQGTLVLRYLPWI